MPGINEASSEIVATLQILASPQSKFALTVRRHLYHIVTTGLVPVVHAEPRWIAGTSPAMTATGEGRSENHPFAYQASTRRTSSADPKITGTR